MTVVHGNVALGMGCQSLHLRGLERGRSVLDVTTDRIRDDADGSTMAASEGGYFAAVAVRPLHCLLHLGRK